MKTKLLRGSALAALGLLAVAVASAAAPARSQAKPTLVREPVITGTASAGSILQATTGSWDNNPTSFSYQWQRCKTAAPSTCDAIKGATKSTYRLADADVDSFIRILVTAKNADGSTSAQSNPVGPVSSGTPPKNTAPPSVTGSATVGSTLTATTGSWSGNPTSFSYQWLRCDAAGDNCGALASDTEKTYKVAGDDASSTLRVRVTAKNADGTGSATSTQTPVVSTGTGGSGIPVSTISLPNRLVISSVKFEPAVIHSRAPFVARFKVADTKGRPIAGALVYALGLPYSWVRGGSEVPTGADGWATVTVNPTGLVPRRGAIVFFVRARKPGDSLLAGVSTRRLVQVTVRM